MSEITNLPVRIGMVGGGTGAFIGGVHRICMRMDGQFDLVAGAFSSDPKTARNSAAELGIANDRCYDSFEEMADKESQREDGIEAVSIVTPNHLHFAVAKAFLNAGIHVICEKPLCVNIDQALELEELVKTSKKLFVLTHNYSGYPLVRQAREMVANGDLGAIRIIQLEYAQDWMTKTLEGAGNKQAEWRSDPSQAGEGGAIADIGTHAFHLASYVTGMNPAELSADLASFGEGRELDDNAHIMLRYNCGARGMLWASQVAPGNENNLRLRIYGSNGGLEWAQENPNQLWFAPFSENKQLITRGGAGTGEVVAHSSRIPAGHPEGYLEGFANIYKDAAMAIRDSRTSGSFGDVVGLPSVGDGRMGVEFIRACVFSSKSNGKWTIL